jgi:hypothetical protein
VFIGGWHDESSGIDSYASKYREPPIVSHPNAQQPYRVDALNF